MTLWQLFKIFLRFGFLAWGGPTSQITMLKEKLVDKKKWISPNKFKRALAIYQTLPGPEAHELCVYLGVNRKGKLGGLIAGLAFILPGFTLILLLSWAYKNYSTTPFLLPFFAGAAPAVAALIVRAAFRVSNHILEDKTLICVGISSAILALLHVHFLLIFAICAIWHFLWIENKKTASILISAILIVPSFELSHLISEISSLIPHSTNKLLFQGLRTALLSFGGSYTPIPFLEKSMVGSYPAITRASFLDGIALVCIIPAPLIMFGTYLGFLAGGFGGAFLITVGIFLPAFCFTLFGYKYVERLIENKTFHDLLDSIAASVAGLLSVTASHIFLSAVTTPLQTIIFTIAIALIYLWKWYWRVPIIIISCGILEYFLSL